MEKTEVILIGGGGHAKVVADCLLSQGIIVKGFFEDKGNGNVLGLPCLGRYTNTVHPDLPSIIAIGDNQTRRRLALREIHHRFFTAIHGSAICSSYADIGEGSMVLHGAIVQAGAVVGRHVILNTGSQIDHDCKIGDYAHIAPSAVLCGAVEVGECTLIGANAVVRPKIRIGKYAVIGAGSVVVRDIPDNAVVAGNPARIMNMNTAP